MSGTGSAVGSAPSVGAPSRNVHPRHDLDQLLHGVRFSVLAVAVSAEKVAFAYVPDALQVSDSVLSKQLTALHEAGYVRIDKVAEGRRARTWLHATDAGRAAFQRHRAALAAIADCNLNPVVYVRDDPP